MRVLIAIVFAAGILAANLSQAMCQNLNCLCTGARGLAEIELVSGGSGTEKPTGRILALHGETGAEAVGDLVPLEFFQSGTAASGRFLVAISSYAADTDAGTPAGTARSYVGPIDAQDNVVCTGAAKPFKVPLAEAPAIVFADDCSEQTAARGFEQPPCNDTSGCVSFGLAGAALGLVALGLRRRR